MLLVTEARQYPPKIDCGQKYAHVPSPAFDARRNTQAILHSLLLSEYFPNNTTKHSKNVTNQTKHVFNQN
eukprot:m.233232 g.233232  ORF g.233232 m.233232 type:complete len:70 (-) comp33637_c0_seq1:2674-2883(-)